MYSSIIGLIILLIAGIIEENKSKIEKKKMDEEWEKGRKGIRGSNFTIP